ncbi:hypothetical protein LTSEGIV_2882 [Salmonella enterica subsp. enterica serovar Give str. S5-487]|nr:hypothetical protein LTSEGIV_2882 [Salmonella enterica subsp. enterica serovar Give str. S5-487]
MRLNLTQIITSTLLLLVALLVLISTKMAIMKLTLLLTVQ